MSFRDDDADEGEMRQLPNADMGVWLPIGDAHDRATR